MPRSLLVPRLFPDSLHKTHAAICNSNPCQKIAKLLRHIVTVMQVWNVIFVIFSPDFTETLVHCLLVFFCKHAFMNGIFKAIIQRWLLRASAACQCQSSKNSNFFD